jgi:HAD superfamily hydrolase (TIGR01509 family)
LSNIHTILLDYGGVYSFEYSLRNYNQAMLSAFGVVPSDEQRRLLRPWFQDLSRGTLDPAEYVLRAADLLGVSLVPTAQWFEQCVVASTRPPSDEMVALVRDLRSDGFKVGLLSDMCDFELRSTRVSGRFSGFDFTSFSARSGMIKQDPECFSVLLATRHVEPTEVLFVDDSLENLFIAAAAGIQTLHADKRTYRSASDLCVDIRRALL